jgi:threonine/homoserine/homoserine lactone efflux protein
VHSIPAFLIVASLVTLSPGPATATIIRVAVRDGRRAALGAVMGNSVGVLLWASLSAIGVSSLILASQLAFTALKIGGAVALVVLGLRSLFHRADPAGPDVADTEPAPHRPMKGWRTGLTTSVSNPKLAVFFVSLFPQFLSPHEPVLPAALAMGGVIVALDVVWYSTLAYAVVRAGSVLKPRVHRLLQRMTGGVMVALGLRLAVETH